MQLKRDHRIIRSRHFRKMQRRHFIVFDVLPFVGTLVAVGLLFYRPIGATELSLFFGFWLITGLGLTVGYHRLFTHRAFATSTAMSAILIIMGSMAGRGPMLSWAAMHRRHHELSDHEGDLHSPLLHGDGVLGRLRGFLHAHLTWMIEHDYPNVAHYVPDLMANRMLVAVNSYYYSWVALGLLLPAAIGGLATMSAWGALSGLLWGGVVRMFAVEQTMSAINSVMHTFGAQPFVTRDDNSRNLGVMAWLAWGRVGTITITPFHIPPLSVCAGSSSMPASSSSARWRRLGSPGTSRCRARTRSPGARCGSRATLRPTWKRAEHHRRRCRR